MTEEEKRLRRNHSVRAWNYGMNSAELHAFFEKHGNRCGICGKPGDLAAHGRGLVLDHDHTCCQLPTPQQRRAGMNIRRTCGKCTRGLLCTTCNSGLGQFGEDPDRFIAALAYLGVKVERIT